MYNVCSLNPVHLQNRGSDSEAYAVITLFLKIIQALFVFNCLRMTMVRNDGLSEMAYQK